MFKCYKMVISKLFIRNHRSFPTHWNMSPNPGDSCEPPDLHPAPGGRHIPMAAQAQQFLGHPDFQAWKETPAER